MSGADPTPSSSDSDSDGDRPMAAGIKVVKDGEVKAHLVRKSDHDSSASSPVAATAAAASTPVGRTLQDTSTVESLSSEDMRSKRLNMLDKTPVSKPPQGTSTPEPKRTPVAVPAMATPTPPAKATPKTPSVFSPEKVMQCTESEANCGYLLRHVLQLRNLDTDYTNENIPSLMTALIHTNDVEDTDTLTKAKAPQELWARVDSVTVLTEDVVQEILDAHPHGENESFLIVCIGRLRGALNDMFVREGFSSSCEVLKQCIKVQYLTTFIPSVFEQGAIRNTAIKTLLHHTDVSAAYDMLEEICHHLSSEHEETGVDVVTSIAQYMLQENDRDVRKAGLPLVTRLCTSLLRLGKSTAGATVISTFVQKETQLVSSMYGNQLEIQSWARRFLVCPFPEEVENLLQGVNGYPKVNPHDTEQVLVGPREIISQLLKDFDTLLKDTLLKKGKAGIKTVMDWLKAVLRLLQPRTMITKDNLRQFEMMQGTKAPHLFALNLAYLIFSLAKPVCDKQGERASMEYVRSKALHEAFPSWKKEVKMERDYAEGAVDGEFNFATEIMFTAANAMHSLVMPSIRVARWAHESFMRALSMAHHDPNEAHSPMLASLAFRWDILRLQLLNLKFIDQATALAVTVCSVVDRELSKDSSKVPECVQAAPAFLLEDALDWAVFVCHFAPQAVKTAEGMPQLLRFAIKACTHPTLLQRHPMLEARVVSLIAAMQDTHRQRNIDDVWNASQWSGHRSTTSLFNIVETSPVCSDLPKVLFKVYSASTSEGFDMDKDDDVLHARDRVLPLFVQLIVVEKFKEGLVAGMSKQADDDDDFTKFMHRLATEATHCLDDALNRLTEVNDIQQLMKDKSGWDALPAPDRKTKEGHMESQGRSARGFMASALQALQIVQMLLNPNRDDQPPPLSPALKSQAVLRSLAHLVRYFLLQMYGSRGDNLKSLVQPEKYDYDRLGVVQTLCNIVSLLSSTVEFSRAFALHDDYERWVVLSTVDEVKKTQLGGLQLLNRLAKFEEELQSLNPQTAAAPASEVSDAVWNPPSGKIPESNEEAFKAKFEDMQSEMIDMGDLSDHYFKNESAEGSKSILRAYKKEFKQFADNPLYPQASVFVRCNEAPANYIRMVITGPENTPYSYGMFVFDVFLPQSYPENPPMVSLRTTGGGTVRFNPNLYENGKVCLSLLNTWHGDGAETKWQPKVSSISQVAISIQSMIFVPDPYFNEPGNERQQNTPEGDKWSAEYNEGLRLGTLRYAILANAKSPPTGCEEVFKQYFAEMAPLIMATAHKWTSEASPSRRPKFLKVLEQLHEVLGEAGDTEICKWVKAERAQLTGRKRGPETQGSRAPPPEAPAPVSSIGASLMSALNAPSGDQQQQEGGLNEEEELMRAIQRSLQEM
eukprot:TRINITY_DN9915_c0_g1_i1.p1 TRINITY_DN9915_c0_g1~~TRINITY_DN9915_c0_g1_i1.p1  ORF type:complete len:1406 (+),score=441.88 TRINITY_DN9915_c0_g1_i1:55-4218(+)